MSTVSRRTLVRAAAVTACAGSLLALPTAAALAEGVQVASAAHSATGPQRTLVKSLALADGVSTAKVYRIGKDAYQADILAADGHKAAALTSRDGVAGLGSAGDLHASLDSEGRLTSWVGETPAPGAAHAVAGDGFKTGTRHGQAVPASAKANGGGTRAVAGRPAEALRLNTLADEPGGGALLLAAGGGIAAVGAAGLGFAMLRRGRTNG